MPRSYRVSHAPSPSVMFARLATSAGMDHSLPRLDAHALEALVRTPGVTTIEFTARWCGPCKTMEPILGALAAEYADRVRLVAVDVHDEPVIAERFSVRSMPTLVLIRDGREIGRVVGSRPRAFISGMLDRALGGDVAIAAP
ncbi:MAG: thioredoxin family protein [Kofleriaceae bacterium]|nr:thioredoxin family protein [Kofleriaceae bacterium]